MRSSVFRFKQFQIDQARATLKVCTDSCLFGAWAAKRAGPARKALDIGTGTGLLALMLAQQHPTCHITGLEIDPACAALAQRNFDASPWPDRLQAHCASLQSFALAQPRGSYDLLVCNPPFFEQQLPALAAVDNLAKHSSHLSQQALLTAMDHLLSDQGETFLLLPPYEAGLFLDQIAMVKLFLLERVNVRNKDNTQVIRALLRLSRQPGPLLESDMAIYDADLGYSTAFCTYLSPYYLAL